MKHQHYLVSALFFFSCLAMLTGTATAAAPSVTEAFALKPVQQGIDCDQPTQAEVAQCTIVGDKAGGSVGWIVRSPNGTILRKFVDTNGDNRVDQWSYYKDGLVIYRDIDSNFNRKVDQCRWFNTAGCRWGIDTNEDSRIDQWKTILPEEVAAEAVAALAAGDWQRLEPLMLDAQEAKSLGLGKEKTADLLKKINMQKNDFQSSARLSRLLDKNTRWLQFSGATPGLVPEGTDGSAKDLTVYENAAAVVETDGRHDEVLLGTLVRVGDGWRMIDVPRVATEGQNTMAGGFFFSPPTSARTPQGTTDPGQVAQSLLDKLEKNDQAMQQATSNAARATLNAQRADLIEQIAEAAETPESRAMWYQQLANTISGAIQTGSYPDGAKRLGQLHEKLSKNSKDKNLAANFRYQQIVAEYGLSFQAEKPDYVKIQENFIQSLKAFVEQYPETPETPEAMLQLAMTLEFLGNEKEAAKWHEEIIRRAPNSPVAEKARGAKIRLDSVGKRIAITGNTSTGQKVDTSDYQGRAVLVQYWATWSEPAKADMAALKELANKYRGQLNIVGVNLDNDPSDLNAFLKESPLPWPQIFEKGGLDSRPANRLGILTVPTMILIDKDGKVVNRNVSVAELDKELKTILR